MLMRRIWRRTSEGNKDIDCVDGYIEFCEDTDAASPEGIL